MFAWRMLLVRVLVVMGALALAASAVQAQGVYGITYEDVNKTKEIVDDPRPIYKDLAPAKVLPPEVYKTLVFDQAAMQKAWADLLGFKSPDVVGKVAPQIKPGKYTVADKEKLPFKDLMIPKDYERFQPGAPPTVGNFTEIEIVPTKQYYWALPIAQASKQGMGKVTHDDEGYLNYDTYQAGFPFPRPAGPHAAQQIMYNWEKRYICGDSYYLMTRVRGFQKELKEDFDSLMEMFVAKLEGRCIMPPLGFFDDRARDNREQRATINCAFSPRDLYGNCFSSLSYSDPNKMDQPMMYLNVFRRVRKMSGTDTQDPMGGQDYIYEDGDGWNQKISKTRYPYKYEIIGETEVIVPSYTEEGGGYLSTKDHEYKGYTWERRPVWVLKLTQLDSNFVYSYRLIWMDKETFLLLHVENYDQKGRLYRDMSVRYVYYPEMGLLGPADLLMRDHVDWHSGHQFFYWLPTEVTRADLSIQKMIKGR